jgi:hypothetical protein
MLIDGRGGVQRYTTIRIDGSRIIRLGDAAAWAFASLTV